MTTATPALDQPKYTPREAAELLGVSTHTLAQWRSGGRYKLPFVKIGTGVRYLASDLEAFIQRQRISEFEKEVTE